MKSQQLMFPSIASAPFNERFGGVVTVHLHSGETSGSGRRPRSFTTPGRGGMLPGERQRLKRAKVEAKRAARAAAKGFDAYSIAMQLDQFVRTQGDMKVEPRPITYRGRASFKK